MQNDTVINCPIEKDKTSTEFLVVVQNQQMQDREHLIRVLLPSSSYQAFLWDGHKDEFKEVEADIFEGKHFDKNNGSFSDSIMYIKANISADSIALLKMVKTENSRDIQLTQDDINKTLAQDRSLTL